LSRIGFEAIAFSFGDLASADDPDCIAFVRVYHQKQSAPQGVANQQESSFGLRVIRVVVQASQGIDEDRDGGGR
jgi:hypothetical protein